MVTLRPLNENDAGILRANLYADLEPDEICALIREWNDPALRAKDFEMYAILHDDKVVGLISLYELSRSVASLGPEVFVSEQQKGHAFKAMELMIRRAKERGFRILQQQIRSDNKASLRLHEKLGFETDHYVYLNRKNHEVFIYLKSL